MQYIKIFLFFSIGFLFSCTNEDDKLDIKDDVTKVNQAPKNFEITIKNVSHSSAKIIWNAAIDPDNDPVKYDIYLENVKIFSDLIDLEANFQNLEELKNYSGYIIAKDSHGNETREYFKFITFKYYLKFMKDYDYGPSKFHGELSSITLTEDNHYLVSGIFSRSVFVFKINAEGDLIWNKYYTFSDPDFYQTLNKPVEIINSNNGSIFTYQHYIVQLDKDGNKIWQKDFREIYGYNQYILLESLKYDQQNNLVVVGNHMSSEFMDDIKGVAVKFSPNKNILWHKSYELDYYNNILDLAFDQNNNIMMFGDTRLEDQNGTYSNAKFWLFKIDTNGNKIFEKKFGDGYCFPIKIINTKDNNFIIQGHWSGAYDKRFDLIKKIDQSGNFIWEHTFQSDEIVQFSVTELSNSDILVTGQDSYNRSMGFSNIRYINLSPDGKKLWQKTIVFDYSYTGGVDVLATDDGGFTMISDFVKIDYNYYSMYPNAKILLLKSDPFGKITM